MNTHTQTHTYTYICLYPENYNNSGLFRTLLNAVRKCQTSNFINSGMTGLALAGYQF